MSVETLPVPTTTTGRLHALPRTSEEIPAAVVAHMQVCRLWWQAQLTGCSMDEFAAYAGVDADTVNAWLGMTTDPTLVQLLMIQDHLPCDSTLGEMLCTCREILNPTH